MKGKLEMTTLGISATVAVFLNFYLEVRHPLDFSSAKSKWALRLIQVLALFFLAYLLVSVFRSYV